MDTFLLSSKDYRQLLCACTGDRANGSEVQSSVHYLLKHWKLQTDCVVIGKHTSFLNDDNIYCIINLSCMMQWERHKISELFISYLQPL